MRGNIRIIAGRFKGKRIPVLETPGLRPTPNRIRETLFNWLMHDIPGARCLDSFAGSGALGFEALSRGATQVVLLEADLKTYAQLLKTAQTFQTTCRDSFAASITIHHADALDYLKCTPLQFDIIFLDPPFQTACLSACLAMLNKRPALLTPSGLVYVESDQPLALDSAHWHCLRQQKAGAVYYGLYTQET